MNAIKLLKQQHREVKGLFALAAKAEGAALQKIAFQICDKLAVHATLEEKHFYPASMLEKTEDLLREAVEEHLGVKRIIADLLEDDPADPQFKAKVTVLKEMVQHHVEEEEEDLFPSVEKALGNDRLKELGLLMEQTGEALLARGNPRKAVPSETDSAAPLPAPNQDDSPRRAKRAS